MCGISPQISKRKRAMEKVKFHFVHNVVQIDPPAEVPGNGMYGLPFQEDLRDWMGPFQMTRQIFISLYLL